MVKSYFYILILLGIFQTLIDLQPLNIMHKNIYLALKNENL